MAEKNLWERALSDPYATVLPSHRPPIVPSAEAIARTGKPAAREPLKQAVVARLRQRYPDLSDLTDDELVSSFHEEMLDQEMKRPIKERALGPESGPDDLLKILGRQGI